MQRMDCAKKPLLTVLCCPKVRLRAWPQVQLPWPAVGFLAQALPVVFKLLPLFSGDQLLCQAPGTRHLAHKAARAAAGSCHAPYTADLCIVCTSGT